MKYNQVLEFFIENGIQLNKNQLLSLHDIYNESMMTAMFKRQQKELKKINAMRVNDFIKRFYTPVKGSKNTLKDIDDPELILLYMDDPDFRKEYGVSDADFKKWNNYMNATVNVRESLEVLNEKAEFSVVDTGLKFKGVSIKTLSNNKKQSPEEIKQLLERDMEDFQTLYNVAMRNMITKLKAPSEFTKYGTKELSIADFEKRMTDIVVKKYAARSTNFKILFSANGDPSFFKGQDVILSISISLQNTIYHTIICKSEEDMKKNMYKEK